MSNTQPGWFPDPTDGSRTRWWDGHRWTEHTAPTQAVLSAQSETPTAGGHARMPVWAWVLIGVVSLLAAFALAPLVAVIALSVLVTAIISLSRGSRTWLRLPSRRAAIGVVAGASMVLLVSGSVSAAVMPRVAEVQTIAEQRLVDATSSPETVEPTRTPVATPTPVTTTREEIVTEAVPFERATVEDAVRPRGEAAVTTPGQDGERSLTYRVTLVDGVEISRELLSDVVTRAAVAEVTSVGTYDAPPPAPAPSECNPNYADACVPNASDVDCAWGSGNGPAYFDGVARVVGVDVYDLDRNNDGWACER